MIAFLQFAALLVSTADDCKQKSLKKLAIADDDATSSYAPHSSSNKKQSISKQNLLEPENLKVNVKMFLFCEGEGCDYLFQVVLNKTR